MRNNTIVYSGFSHFCFWQCSDSRLTGSLPVHDAPPISVRVSGRFTNVSPAAAAAASMLPLLLPPPSFFSVAFPLDPLAALPDFARESATAFVNTMSGSLLKVAAGVTTGFFDDDDDGPSRLLV